MGKLPPIPRSSRAPAAVVGAGLASGPLHPEVGRGGRRNERRIVGDGALLGQVGLVSVGASVCKGVGLGLVRGRVAIASGGTGGGSPLGAARLAVHRHAVCRGGAVRRRLAGSAGEGVWGDYECGE